MRDRLEFLKDHQKCSKWDPLCMVIFAMHVFVISPATGDEGNTWSMVT